MARRERMTPVDHAWLRMDRPANLMMIVGILMLEGQVDPARLEGVIAERLLRHARFRQRVERTLTGPFWSDDPHFDPRRHISRVRLPGAGGKAELEAFVAGLASQPLDPNRPLWQFHLVEHYEGGIAVVARIHHAVGDGIALIGVLLSLTDEGCGAAVAPDGATGQDDFGLGALVATLSVAIGEGLRVSGSLFRLAADPTQWFSYARAAAGFAGEFAWLLAMPSDTRTRLKGSLSGDKRVAWADPISLQEVKAVGHALGCSVNDTMLASVAGALRGYLAGKGDKVADVEVRALVPVNLRPPDAIGQLGNQFGMVAVVLPVGISHPLERLHEVRRRMEALKHSYEPAATLMLIAGLGYGPKLVQDQMFDLLLSRATAVMTNVPGPQHPLHIAGGRVRQVLFWVPQSGEIGIGLSILSYGGQVQFGVVTDAALVPDPEAIVERFRAEFEALLYMVLLGPWDTAEIAGTAQLSSDSRANAASSRSISSAGSQALASE